MLINHQRCNRLHTHEHEAVQSRQEVWYTRTVKRKESKKTVRNPIAVAMLVRHGSTSTRMRDRRVRRPFDARRRDEW